MAEQERDEDAPQWHCIEATSGKQDMGFVPISESDYLKLHMKSNPSENSPEFLARLRQCVRDALAGARCHCGEPIWVIGSAAAHYACFTCITGEADGTDDYEIDEVLASRRRLSRRP